MHYHQSMITAFLYAGALQHPTKGVLGGEGADFEHWEGHTGFVEYCTWYAEAIDKWLDTRKGDLYPGVIYYELFEPMGEWMIGMPEPLSVHEALEHFKIEYIAWVDTQGESNEDI